MPPVPLTFDPLNPAPICEPCSAGTHSDCQGWASGFCACSQSLCLLRLRTGVMWTIHPIPEQEKP